jgi:hypothetical protein
MGCCRAECVSSLAVRWKPGPWKQARAFTNHHCVASAGSAHRAEACRALRCDQRRQGGRCTCSVADAQLGPSTGWGTQTHLVQLARHYLGATLAMSRRNRVLSRRAHSTHQLLYVGFQRWLTSMPFPCSIFCCYSFQLPITIHDSLGWFPSPADHVTDSKRAEPRAARLRGYVFVGTTHVLPALCVPVLP